MTDRDYTETFLRRYGCSEEEVSTLLGAYDRIADSETAADCWIRAADIYAASETCDWNEALRCGRQAGETVGVHPYTADLLTVIRLSARLKARYAARGIPESIFHDSMADVKYKLDECRLVKGICGTFVGSWYSGFFNLTRFALGRLQFEVLPFGHEYTGRGRTLTPDSKAINVHIPRTGTPLGKADCDDAYARAGEFFRDAVSPPVFMCHSWLLFPEHSRMLPPNSNIRRFMSEYEIVESGMYADNAQAWRLFDTEETDPDKLPADSSLRRTYIQYFKSGGVMGWGFGVRFA